MAFYVSAIKHDRQALAVGPFRRHGDALAMVRLVQRWATRNVRDVDHFSTAWGTARHRSAHPAGRLNAAYGVTVDNDGFVLAAEREEVQS